MTTKRDDGYAYNHGTGAHVTRRKARERYERKPANDPDPEAQTALPIERPAIGMLHRAPLDSTPDERLAEMYGPFRAIVHLWQPVRRTP